MRVIAGSARRLQLKTLEGIETRPTTDRIKETLFNMLSPYVYDCVFLDLFAGSGGIGIEALSRGAMEAVFVEKNPRAMQCVKDNLSHTHLERKGMTMDPPYGQELERRVLTYLSGSELLAPEGVIIVETAKDTDFAYAEELGFTIIKNKVYKTNKHVFLEPTGRKGIC